MPKMVICSEPPYASRLSPEATVPLSGPTVTGSPVAMAGFFVPLKTVVPPLAFTNVKVEEMESCDRASGAVMDEVTVTVAAVPSCVAVIVAAPPPKMPQSAVIVAVWGVTASALGANASEAVARTPSPGPHPCRSACF